MGTGPKQKAALAALGHWTDLLTPAREHRLILVSPAVYKEIWELLIEAGYDYLVWPDNGRITMDGFIIGVRENAGEGV